MNVLAIDPGSAAPGSACAYVQDGELVRVDFSYRPAWYLADVVVVEKLAFRGAADVPRAKHLIAMACAGYLAAGHALATTRAAKLVELTPLAWKGTEQKPIQHARLWKMLRANERRLLGGDATARAIRAAVEKGALARWSIAGADCYPRSFKTHNLLDATAMAMVYVGRLEKR